MLKNIKAEKLNPSVKAITILIAAILIALQYITLLNTIIFVSSIMILLLFSEVKIKQLISILIPALMAAFGIFLMGLYYAKNNTGITTNLSNFANEPYAVRAALSTNFNSAVALATRLLAYSGLGIFFALTTDGEEFVASLIHQCGMSPKFAYGIIAAVNMLPQMVRENKTVKLAYKIRGIKVRFFSSRVLFTMLVNSIRASESLALAMESKGFTGNKDRTYYSITKIHWYDILFSFALLGGIILGMIFCR